MLKSVPNMRKIYLICLLMSFVSNAWCGEMQGLYDAELPITDQSQAAREAALQVALHEVLIRATGKQTLEESEALSALMARAPEFVKSYNYLKIERPPIPKSDEDLPVIDEEVREDLPDQTLHIVFDDVQLNKAIQGMGWPIWGSTRPSVLMLVAMETSAGRKLVQEDSLNHWYKLLENTAWKRGLPLLFPLLDLEDQSRFSITDIWGNFGDTLLSAAQRYNPDGVLVGKIYKKGMSNWQSQWTLHHGDQRKSWWYESASQADALTAGLDETANVLAAYYAQIVDEASLDVLRLQVTGVSDLQHYVRVLNYLLTLELVDQAQVAQIDSASASFLLNIHGGRDNLVRLIELGNVLIPPRTSVDDNEVEADLVYQLLP
jgi:hypothetical protein